MKMVKLKFCYIEFSFSPGGEM